MQHHLSDIYMTYFHSLPHWPRNLHYFRFLNECPKSFIYSVNIIVVLFCYSSLWNILFYLDESKPIVLCLFVLDPVKFFFVKALFITKGLYPSTPSRSELN